MKRIASTLGAVMLGGALVIVGPTAPAQAVCTHSAAVHPYSGKLGSVIAWARIAYYVTSCFPGDNTKRFIQIHSVTVHWKSLDSHEENCLSEIGWGASWRSITYRMWFKDSAGRNYSPDEFVLPCRKELSGQHTRYVLEESPTFVAWPKSHDWPVVRVMFDKDNKGGFDDHSASQRRLTRYGS